MTFCFQTNKLKGVEREPYSGPVSVVSAQTAPVVSPVKPNQNGSTPESGQNFGNRPNTSGGGRNMQESSFAFSGEYFSGLGEHVAVK